MLQAESTNQQERDAATLEAARRLTAEVLRPAAAEIDRTGAYPLAQMQKLAAAGFMGISIPVLEGGSDLSFQAQAELFMILAEGCLTVAFILTQHHGCSTLFTASQNTAMRRRWLPELASGNAHGGSGFNFLNMPPERAPMLAVPVEGGYRLTGSLPWVTAAHQSDVVAAGAILPDMTQIMAAVPLRPALAAGTATIDPPMQLAGLTASDTTVIHCMDLFAPAESIILGPDPAILKATFRGATTYVPTALTIGHARAALALLDEAASRKGGPASAMAEWVRREADALQRAVLGALAADDFSRAARLRGRGNTLAARAAHFALIVGGGTGYRQAETAQRLYREAGFFSVWSVSGEIIPQTLANLLSPLE